MKRAIISGATGAVGTAIIHELIRQGTEVLVLCREGSERNRNIPEHELVHRRFCPLSGLSTLEPDGKKYDVFYHLAWEGTTGRARDDMYLQNQNVKYALDAVGAAARFGCSTFIGAGSQAEYGRVEGVLKPDTPAFPVMGYGMGKLAAGQMTRVYAHACGMRHIWVRILSIYGPNDGKQSMVMSTIEKLKTGQTAQFTKAEQIWDYLYSGDAGRAFVMLGDQGKDGKIYVLGSGKPKPLRTYIEEIREAVSPDAALEFGVLDYYPHQVMHLEADISELKNDTGWEPLVPFKEGVKMIL